MMKYGDCNRSSQVDPQNHSWESGFTFPELLCVVLITAVLLTLAVPYYLESRTRILRTEAMNSLYIAHQCMARRLALSHTQMAGQCAPQNSDDYRFFLVSMNDEEHEWRAEPLGAQKEDDCGTLALDARGSKKVLGAALNVSRCWDGR